MSACFLKHELLSNRHTGDLPISARSAVEFGSLTSSQAPPSFLSLAVWKSCLCAGEPGNDAISSQYCYNFIQLISTHTSY